MPAYPQVVPPASVTVSDDILEQAIAASVAFEEGRPESLDLSAQALFLHVAGPAMRECLQWRRRVGVIRDLVTPDNVILMTGARG